MNEENTTTIKKGVTTVPTISMFYGILIKMYKELG